VSKHFNLLLAAAENLAANARLYAVASLGLVLPLFLLLSGVAIIEGLMEQALAAVDSGADVYCTWDMFGRDAAVPRPEVRRLGEIGGVTKVVPRIIGRLRVGGEVAIVIGVPLDVLRNKDVAVLGAVPAAADEVLVGSDLARSLGVGPGKRLGLEASVARVFTVSGVTGSTSAFWSSKAIVCAIEEAALLFGESEHVSDVCLQTRPGLEAAVAVAVERVQPRFRVQTRGLVHAYVVRGMTVREGIFTVLLALALALAVPVYATFTYLGYVPRRREIGLLKVEGWRTSEVLEMIALENLLVSAAASAVALLLAFVWVDLLRAPLIAPFFIADLPLFPHLHIPSKYLPLPPVLAFTFSLLVTMVGSIYSTWRTAVARPAEVLK
jgi:ABC-type lipoprotein release transport system permease subunit